jgi:hypothetical protein
MHQTTRRHRQAARNVATLPLDTRVNGLSKIYVGFLATGVAFVLLKYLHWPYEFSEAHQFNIQQFSVLPTQCIYVFCVDLRTNSDYFPIQH